MSTADSAQGAEHRPHAAAGAASRWRSGWFDAAAVIGVAAAIFLLARSVRPFVADMALWLRAGSPPAPEATDWVRLVVAAATVAVALRGWSLVAAILAWATVAVELFALVVDDPAGWSAVTPAVTTVWPVLVSAVVAVLLSIPDAAGRARRQIRGSDLVLLWGTAVVVAFGPAVIVALGEVDPSSDVLFAVSGRTVAAMTSVTYLLMGGAVVQVALGLEPNLRTRALVVLAAVAALLTAVQLGADRPFSMDTLSPPPLSGPAYLAVCVAAPLVVLAVGAVLIRRGDPETR